MEYTIKIIHMIPALTSVLLGVSILNAKKGDRDHKLKGRIWAGLMLFVAITGFFITGGPLEIYAGYGYIHFFSIITIISISLAIWALKKRRYKLHAICMISTFVGLITAGVFAVLMPDRILHDWVF